MGTQSFITGTKPGVVVVLGATGIGKSRLGVDIAARLNGEVINADAMQIYEGLDITTNKISTEEMAGVPHHLLGVVNTCQEWTVMDFRDAAVKVIADVISRGKLPVVVGGSNYYIQSLVGEVLLDDWHAPAGTRDDAGGSSSTSHPAPTLDGAGTASGLDAMDHDGMGPRRISDLDAPHCSALHRMSDHGAANICSPLDEGSNMGTCQGGHPASLMAGPLQDGSAPDVKGVLEVGEGMAARAQEGIAASAGNGSQATTARSRGDYMDGSGSGLRMAMGQVKTQLEPFHDGGSHGVPSRHISPSALARVTGTSGDPCHPRDAPPSPSGDATPCSPRAKLHAQLACVDPVMAARLHPNDVRRVARALEIFESTGRRPSELFLSRGTAPGGAMGGGRGLRYDCCFLWVDCAGDDEESDDVAVDADKGGVAGGEQGMAGKRAGKGGKQGGKNKRKVAGGGGENGDGDGDGLAVLEDRLGRRAESMLAQGLLREIAPLHLVSAAAACGAVSSGAAAAAASSLAANAPVGAAAPVSGDGGPAAASDGVAVVDAAASGAFAAARGASADASGDAAAAPAVGQGGASIRHGAAAIGHGAAAAIKINQGAPSIGREVPAVGPGGPILGPGGSPAQAPGGVAERSNFTHGLMQAIGVREFAEFFAAAARHGEVGVARALALPAGCPSVCAREAVSNGAVLKEAVSNGDVSKGAVSREVVLREAVSKDVVSNDALKSSALNHDALMGDALKAFCPPACPVPPASTFEGHEDVGGNLPSPSDRSDVGANLPGGKGTRDGGKLRHGASVGGARDGCLAGGSGQPLGESCHAVDVERMDAELQGLLRAAMEALTVNTCRLARQQRRRITKFRTSLGWRLHRLNARACLGFRGSKEAEQALWEATVLAPALHIVKAWQQRPPQTQPRQQQQQQQQQQQGALRRENGMKEQELLDVAGGRTSEPEGEAGGQSSQIVPDLWKKRYCEVCNGRMLRGTLEWEAHVRSRNHRRLTSKKKKWKGSAPGDRGKAILDNITLDEQMAPMLDKFDPADGTAIN